MRWRHPIRGMMAPIQFIPVAEQTNAIVALGAWAPKQGCQDVAKLPGDIKLMVNVSARQFDSDDLLPAVSKALALSNLPASRLELEITETLILRNTAATKETIRKLQALGVSVALDDFGKAFASFNYLQNFTFDKLKIDRSFLEEDRNQKDPSIIIELIAAMARRLNIRTVAEGVETPFDLKRIQSAGWDQAQGFYFSKPMPIKALRRYLSKAVAVGERR
ncbi:MAG: EAL domain-containing protein [Chitinophagaceae bacterium]|nr:EAL domain-containing protein [Anaerolineae bacterium]